MQAAAGTASFTGLRVYDSDTTNLIMLQLEDVTNDFLTDSEFFWVEVREESLIVVELPYG